MTLFRLIFFTLLTIGMVLLLNRPNGSLPALGRLMDPFGGYWANASPEAFPSNNTITLQGLDKQVVVQFDERAVPHIYAASLEDAVYAQGYVTARDRLWQMEFQTHAAAGRLASIFGPDSAPGDGKILQHDRMQRRIGIGYAAEIALDVLAEDKQMMALLQAYSDGVNEWISSLKPRDYPLEYKLVGYAPEAWSPLKTAYLLKYMGQTLTAREFDLEYTLVLDKIGPRAFERLFEDQGGNLEPVIPSGTTFDFLPIDLDTPTAKSELSLSNWDFELPEPPDAGIGSNNWAVAGSKTASGVPILANDPHLRLNLPSLWYEAQLTVPDYSVYGATLPGAPGVVIGFNQDVAWGVTNAGRDVRDWYQISFDDESRSSYQFEDYPRATTKRIEKIEIRGAESLIDTVVYTHHGPVVYDHAFGHSNLEGFALRWELHQPSEEMRTFFELNRAKNYEDYRAALKWYQCPGQNFVFASRNGDIAITQQGRFPARWPDQGRFLMDGSKAVNDWQAYIPNEQNATVKNPPRGFVSSANQFPADSTYPYYQLGNFAKYRNRRINAQLENMQDIDVNDMRQLQLDNYDVMAEDILPTMLKLCPEAAALADWDRMHNTTSREASRFQSWYDTFYRLTWDEFTSMKDAHRIPEYFFTNRLMKDDPDSRWFDMMQTPEREDLGDLLKIAWEQSDTSVMWWEYKKTGIDHLIPTLTAFSEEMLKCGGGKGIVNATTAKHGPSWRMVVELSDPPRAWGVYPGGQSGNPGSAGYAAFIDEWAEGAFFELNYWPEPSKDFGWEWLLNPADK